MTDSSITFLALGRTEEAEEAIRHGLALAKTLVATIPVCHSIPTV